MSDPMRDVTRHTEPCAVDWCPNDRLDGRNDCGAHEVPACMMCGSTRVDASETDEREVFWTHCRPCDAWTEHPEPHQRDR